MSESKLRTQSMDFAVSVNCTKGSKRNGLLAGIALQNKLLLFILNVIGCIVNLLQILRRSLPTQG